MGPLPRSPFRQRPERRKVVRVARSSRRRLVSGVEDSPIAKRGWVPRSRRTTERPSRRAMRAMSDPGEAGADDGDVEVGRSGRASQDVQGIRGRTRWLRFMARRGETAGVEEGRAASDRSRSQRSAKTRPRRSEVRRSMRPSECRRVGRRKLAASRAARRGRRFPRGSGSRLRRSRRSRRQPRAIVWPTRVLRLRVMNGGLTRMNTRRSIPVFARSPAAVAN